MAQIPTLRGLDQEELEEMDHVAKWQAEQRVLAEDADGRLQNYSPAEYRMILDTAVDMVRNFDASAADHIGRQTFHEDFPSELEFIKPDMIHVMDSHCIIYLQKGIGKGIGYSVELSDAGEWSIAWFNEYDDWRRTTIDVARPKAAANR